MGLHRKSNKAHATETLDKLKSTNKNALLETDMFEKLKVIDLQKHEIIKLRNQIRGLEGFSSRPTSVEKLPPMEVS